MTLKLASLFVREDAPYQNWYPIDASILTGRENKVVDEMIREAVKHHCFAYPAPKLNKLWIHELYPFDYDETMYESGKLVKAMFTNCSELEFNLLYHHNAEDENDIDVVLVTHV